ncbi:DUF6232 family protein [Streptomyces filamentosus]|uniref:DUF6232 family protein n=1 Tax=Streptomyces filamentosus TaxID=67294 RepID=UPI0036E2ADD5
MDQNVPPTPPTPPPTPPAPPPTPPSERPWKAAPTHIQGSSPLDLRVDRRVLWVGGAAYPLENIVRVYTFVLRPRRADAVMRFGKRLSWFVLALLLLTVVDGLTGSSRGSGPYGDGGSDAGVLFGLIRGGLIIALIYFFAEMLGVVTARSHLTLAVETNGRSTALVTGPPELLHRLVHDIAHAIENTDAELHARVASLAIGNPGNYYFGDVVNMYGGSGNTGVLK